MALEAHGKVAERIDPRKDETSATMTVGALVEAFIEKHARKLKTGKAFATRLRSNVSPIIGSVKLSELHRRDVHRVLDKIEERGSPLAAAKAQQDVRTMVRWAIKRGYLDADPDGRNGSRDQEQAAREVSQRRRRSRRYGRRSPSWRSPSSSL